MGNLMALCFIKFAEMSEEQQKYKGRMVLRGDDVRDEEGAMAVFQELSSQPTNIADANSNIAYGCLPGHTTTTVDAIRAYVQSTLNSLHEIWIALPKELWPPEWHQRGYVRPMVRLIKALHGHPESGGYWERHLSNAI